MQGRVSWSSSAARLEAAVDRFDAVARGAPALVATVANTLDGFAARAAPTIARRHLFCRLLIPPDSQAGERLPAFLVDRGLRPDAHLTKGGDLSMLYSLLDEWSMKTTP